MKVLNFLEVKCKAGFTLRKPRDFSLGIN